MAWKQLYLEVDKSCADPFSELLTELGAQAVTFEDAEDQPILEPGVGETPLWDLVTVIALFDENFQQQMVLDLLEKQFPQQFKFLKSAQLEDQNWERAWMEDFHAMQFGDNLWVCPSWQTPPQPDAVNLMMDPGLAFGSGTHETTSLCLKWLEKINLHNKTLIDFGCGSGILAIAALKLGAKQAQGFDTDEQAILASRENAQRNNIPDEQFPLKKVSPTHHETIQPADILIANILAEPLRELAPYFSGLVKSGGQMGLSGILESQTDELLSIYQKWFDMEIVVQENDWCFLSGIKY